MKNNIKDYLNDYLYGAAIFIVAGLIIFITGYGYSPATGVISIKSPIGMFIFFAGLAFIFLILDIIYVHFKRRYRKQGKYKNEE